MLRLTLVLAIAALFASPVRAAEDSVLEAAKAHAARAKVHYDLGEYEKAADEYIQVYRLRPLPALLYNIGQCYRQAGQYEKAKQFYKSYLREAKDATPSNRQQVERAIQEIDELQAKEKRAKESPPKGVAATPPVTGGSPALAPPPAAGAAPTPGAAAGGAAAAGAVAGSAAAGTAAGSAAAGTAAGAPAAAAGAPAAAAAAKTPLPPSAVATSTVQPSSSNRKTYAYISAGASVLAIAGGLAFLSKASKYEDELNARPHPQATIDDLSSTAKSSKTIGVVLLGTGLVAGVGAGLLYFLPTHDGVAVQGKF